MEGRQETPYKLIRKKLTNCLRLSMDWHESIEYHTRTFRHKDSYDSFKGSTLQTMCSQEILGTERETKESISFDRDLEEESSCHCRTGQVQFGSVAQSCPTLRPHELQHTRPPCPTPTPRVH